jgi:hypothetical protein
MLPGSYRMRLPKGSSVTDEIRRFSSQYGARLSAHPNDLAVNLMAQPDDNMKTFAIRSAYQILSVIIVIIDFIIKIQTPQQAYGGALLSPLLRASVYVICIYTIC